MKPDPYKEKSSRKYQAKHGLLPPRPKKKALPSNSYRYEEPEEEEDPYGELQTKETIDILKEESLNNLKMKTSVLSNIANTGLFIAPENLFESLFSIDIEQFQKEFSALSNMEKYGFDLSNDDSTICLSDLEATFANLVERSQIRKGKYAKDIEILNPSDFKKNEEQQKESSDDELNDLLNLEQQDQRGVQSKKEISVTAKPVNSKEETKELEDFLDEIL